MATFRDSGLELNIKPDISDITNPTGDRVTIFAVDGVSPSGRNYVGETGKQVWVVDSSGTQIELTNGWIEGKVEETSAKLDEIYPAVTQFMSAGLLFLNSTTTQTISSDLNIIGNTSISGSVDFTSDCATTFTGDVSSYGQFNSYGSLNINVMGTPDTLENIAPFFIRSSANRLHPDGWSDPALLVIGNTKVYDMFKPTDRGLRFTVLNRENLHIIHDEVYDTAGSQFRVTDLALKMFTMMNNRKHVGILNSREDWESLIWRKQTVESVGTSAGDLNPAWANLTIGSLLDQFDRFGLVKAIRAAGQRAEMYPTEAGSQYCAIFEGSDILTDTSGTSSVIYPTNRAVESWVPRVSETLPVSGEQQRAQLAGWFIQPRQLDITNNIADRSAAFVTLPYGRENDAVREMIFVNKDGTPGDFNVKVDNLTTDVLTTSFNVSSGVWHLKGNMLVDAPIDTVVNAPVTTINAVVTTVNSTETVTVNTSAATINATIVTVNAPDVVINGTVDMTTHKITALGYADIDEPGDAVSVDFSRVVMPIGAVTDFAGSVAPANWFFVDGSAKNVSSAPLLFSVIGYTYGGSGDTFYLPNAMGKSSLGAGSALTENATGGFDNTVYTLGATGGEAMHTLSTAEMPSHNHTFTTYQDDYANPSGGQPPPGFLRDGTAAVVWSTSTAGSGHAHNNLPPFIVFNKIIRYK